MKHLIAITLICLVSILHAQNTESIDSLTNLLEQDLSPTERVDLLVKLTNEYSGKDTAKVAEYVTKAITLAEKINYKNGLLDAKLELAWSKLITGRYDEAIEIYDWVFKETEEFTYDKARASAYHGSAIIKRSRGNYDEAIDRHLKAIEYYELADYKKGLSQSYNSLGIVYHIKNNFKEAIKYHEKSLKLDQDLKNQKGIASSYNNLGLVYGDMDQLPQAIENYLLSIEAKKLIGNKRGLAFSYNNVGLIYCKLGDYPTATKYYFNSIELKEELGLKKSTASTYNNLGKLYQLQKKYDKALECFTKSLKIKEEINYKQSIASSYLHIGAIHQHDGNYEKALEFYNKAVTTNEELGDKRGKVTTLLHLAEFHIELEEFDQGLEYAKQCYELSMNNKSTSASAEALYLQGKSQYYLKRYSASKSSLDLSIKQAKEIDLKIIIRKSSKLLVEVNKALKNPNAALDAYAIYHQYYDSLLGEQKSKQLALLEIQYETKKKEQEIENLTQRGIIQELELKQSRFNLVLSVGAIGFLILGGFILLLVSRQRRLSLIHKSQDIEQKLLRVQMNPHFIFNSMSSIQDFMISGDSNSASKYLSKFSKLIRQVLDNSRTEYITLDQEIGMLENYLSLQNLKRKEPVNFEITVSEEIEKEEMAIPPMFAQPFVENAIEHGLKSKTEEANIKIDFSQDGDQLILKISDNGIGIGSKGIQKKEGHISHAMQITKERISLYKEKNKRNISFDIKSLSEGTQIIFNLPFRYI